MLVPLLPEATVVPLHAYKGDLQCHLHLLRAFSSGGVQASNSGLPKVGGWESLALIFVKGRDQVREQRNRDSRKRKGWMRRCGRKVSTRRDQMGEMAFKGAHVRKRTKG